MKTCASCLEPNHEGATHCALCGEPLEVSQAEELPSEAAHEVLEPLFPLPPRTTPPPPPPPQVKVPTADTPQLDISKLAEAPVADTLLAPPAEPAASEPSFESHAELIARLTGGAPSEPSAAPVATPTPSEAPVEAAPAVELVAPGDTGPTRPVVAPPPVAAPVPALGPLALEVYHDTEPRVVHRHLLNHDVTLIGREDPQRDVFPDLDLGKLTDLGVSAASASREHLRILRQEGQVCLIAYPGSTGTQVNKALIEAGKRVPLAVGDRIILGGLVRMKLVAA